MKLNWDDQDFFHKLNICRQSVRSGLDAACELSDVYNLFTDILDRLDMYEHRKRKEIESRGEQEYEPENN